MSARRVCSGTRPSRYHFGARDLGATETTSDLHLDAFRALAHGVLHDALHGAAEHHATLQLLRHVLATSLASRSGLRISSMLMCTGTPIF